MNHSTLFYFYYNEEKSLIEKNIILQKSSPLEEKTNRPT